LKPLVFVVSRLRIKIVGINQKFKKIKSQEKTVTLNKDWIAPLPALSHHKILLISFQNLPAY
jgi:glycerol-3-phosphate responsive antiterminator